MTGGAVRLPATPMWLGLVLAQGLIAAHSSLVPFTQQLRSMARVQAGAHNVADVHLSTTQDRHSEPPRLPDSVLFQSTTPDSALL